MQEVCSTEDVWLHLEGHALSATVLLPHDMFKVLHFIKGERSIRRGVGKKLTFKKVVFTTNFAGQK